MQTQRRSNIGSALVELLRPDRLAGCQPALLVILGGFLAIGSGWLMSAGAIGSASREFVGGLVATMPLACLAWHWRNRAFRVISRERHLREMAQEQADRQISRDPVTGFLSADCFRFRATQLLEAAGGEPQAVGLLVLKLVERRTDGTGPLQEQSDRAILWVAGLISGAVRATDLVTRLDSDRFLVVIRRGGRPALLRVRDRLFQKARAGHQKPSPSLDLLVGQASSDARGISLDDLIAVAMAEVNGPARTAAADLQASHDLQAKSRRPQLKGAIPGASSPSAS